MYIICSGNINRGFFSFKNEEKNDGEVMISSKMVSPLGTRFVRYLRAKAFVLILKLPSQRSFLD
jgi:hypothetical protein